MGKTVGRSFFFVYVRVFDKEPPYDTINTVIRLIRNNVKDVMDALGVSTRELSDATGINRSVIGRYYRNEVTRFDFNVLDALCTELRVPVSYLIEYIPDESMTDDDREHLRIREAYANRTSEYWQRYKRKNAPNESDE